MYCPPLSPLRPHGVFGGATWYDEVLLYCCVGVLCAVTGFRLADADTGTGGVLKTGAILNVLSLNINGVRTGEKRTMLGKLLHDLQVGVCLLTETHLREDDLDTFDIPHYHVVADYCRPTPVGEWIKGGVLILVHTNFDADELPKLTSLAPHIEHCSCTLFPTDDPATAIRVSGVYIPPTRGRALTMGRLQKMTAPLAASQGGDVVPHLLGGDFNITSWPGLFEEWLQEDGIWELTDPVAPTFASGSAIDKFLFVPGAYIPSTLLPSGVAGELSERGDDEALFYPADVLMCTHMSDHLPIILPLPCDEEERPSANSKKIRVAGLSDETWGERNDELAVNLGVAWPPEALERPVVNVGRLHRTIEAALDRTFFRERSTPGPPVKEDPLSVFLRRHARHPELDSLLGALEARDMTEADRLMRRMSADGWREYLKSVHRNDTRAFFAYLARAEGRKRKGFVPADSRPMRDPRNGSLVVTPLGKVALITSAFGERFSAPAVVNPSLQLDNPNNLPLPPYRRQVEGQFERVSLPELKLALSKLSSGKAPGQDGFPVEMFKRLPVLWPYVLALINAIYNTGQIPGGLRSVIIVSFPKPGKDSSDPANRRPISLLNSIVKLLECVIYHRLLPRVARLNTPIGVSVARSTTWLR